MFACIFPRFVLCWSHLIFNFFLPGDLRRLRDLLNVVVVLLLIFVFLTAFFIFPRNVLRGKLLHLVSCQLRGSYQEKEGEFVRGPGERNCRPPRNCQVFLSCRSCWVTSFGGGGSKVLLIFLTPTLVFRSFQTTSFNIFFGPRRLGWTGPHQTPEPQECMGRCPSKIRGSTSSAFPTWDRGLEERGGEWVPDPSPLH